MRLWVGLALALLVAALVMDITRLDRARQLKATLQRSVPIAIGFDQAVDALLQSEYRLEQALRQEAAVDGVLAASVVARDSVARMLLRLAPVLETSSLTHVARLQALLVENAAPLRALQAGATGAAAIDLRRLLNRSREAIRAESSSLTSTQRELQAAQSFGQIRVSESLAFVATLGGCVSLLLVAGALRVSTTDSRSREAAEQRLRVVLDVMHEGVVLEDADGAVLLSNPAAVRFFGEPATARASPAAGVRVTPPSITLSPTCPESTEECVSRGDGEEVWVETSVTMLVSDAGHPSGVLRVSRDITERRAMEQRLRQAERLQAVGTLAGGIAHDFNNLIAVVHGTAELLQEEIVPHLQADVQTILTATGRARRLTQQMLTFARRRRVETAVHGLDEVVRTNLPLLTHLLATPTQLTVHFDAPDATVRIDPDELGTAIINLVTNARDAMPTGAVVRLETDTALVSGRRATDRVAPGRYARVRVRDTGHGMAPEVVGRVFEPFFTTKAVGAGTGLGLATVHGILKDFGGAVTIDSTIGLGTTVTLWLPLDETVAVTAAPTAPAAVVAPSRRILIVDDDEQVRTVVARLARVAGHRAVMAESFASALEFLDAAREPVDLVISDYAMPDGTGRDLLEAVRARWPELPLALMSGYIADDATQEWMEQRRISYLSKPFTRAELDALVSILT